MHVVPYTDLFRIRNPLAGVPKSELLHDVEVYAQENQLDGALEHLRKGALIAQRPDDFEAIEELDGDDLDVLRREKTHRWVHPKMLYFTIVLNSISAAIQGWDQTGSNGANLSFPQAFGIADSGQACTAAGTCERNSWIIGAINGAPYMAICLLYARSLLGTVTTLTMDYSVPVGYQIRLTTSLDAEAPSSLALYSACSAQSVKPFRNLGLKFWSAGFSSVLGWAWKKSLSLSSLLKTRQQTYAELLSCHGKLGSPSALCLASLRISSS